MRVKLLSGKCYLILGTTFNPRIISRNLYKTHYDTLKVKRDCSNKEIREAFIKLSKQHHPDTTKCLKSHHNFVRIVEAYNVLSKPDRRRSYDLGLAIAQNTVDRDDSYYNHVSQRSSANDPIFWNNRDRSQDKYYESKPYYGIKGIKRVSNATIALICLMVTVIGVALQIIAISASVTFKRDKLLKASAEAEKVWADLQEKARKNSYNVQMEELEKRLKENSLAKGRDI